ncbi:sialate O-acetylesterase [Chitinophaga barathri]|uniref:Sialate O-acetylesterase n=1 Tax=Chitinophaga barathri TaxID=1647451 RepID=A0A3N4MCJ7_9BACT|nr:sialate O-acetylesterase [Chitinophaga barathri]RPD41125.1 sialate O-acetylesterase [Chitinophaga barathri]
MLRYLLTSLLLCCCLFAGAQIRLPAVIADNMVLQQNDSVMLWGWAGPGEKIRVTTSWNGRVDSVVTTRDAKWQLKVKTPAAGGPYDITLRGNTTVKLQNVLIGEVWVCSGQSNMEWSANHGLKQMAAEMPICADANIRFFHVPKTTATYPQDDAKASWTACDSNNLKRFSAVAYFFGKKLRKDLNVPIGLINTSWGGTPAEVWTPAQEVTSQPALVEAAGKLTPSNGWPNQPGYTYNAMIAPFIQYSIAGAIWYQGESNAGTASTYDQLMRTMIGSWRKAWGREFPFYFVQIAPYNYGKETIKGALLREAQTVTSAYGHTGMIVITDLVNDTANIHPQNKQDVGIRLANWAMGDHYSKTGIAYKSPMYDKMEQRNGKIVVYFKNAENGLKVNGGKPTQFYIAGADKQFWPADVKIEGNTAIVSAKAVKQPEAVRFSFTNTGIGNVFSKEGLPVGPFRTDNWQEK